MSRRVAERAQDTVVAVDNWCHDHLPATVQCLIAWPVCDLQEIVFGAPWRLVARERLTTTWYLLRHWRG